MRQPLYSPAEYLALERAAAYWHEYVDGQLIERARSNQRHSLITSNISAEIGQQFRRRSCEVYAVNMRVKIATTEAYVYPDIVAVCGEPRFEDSHTDTLINPTVIVEVLSPSTEAYDRGEKFAHYRRLDSLMEYVLVAQDKVRIEHYARQGDGWLLTEISDRDGVLRLAAIGCAVPLRDMYDKVDFEDAAPKQGCSAQPR